MTARRRTSRWRRPRGSRGGTQAVHSGTFYVVAGPNGSQCPSIARKIPRLRTSFPSVRRAAVCDSRAMQVITACATPQPPSCCPATADAASIMSMSTLAGGRRTSVQRLWRLAGSPSVCHGRGWVLAFCQPGTARMIDCAAGRLPQRCGAAVTASRLHGEKPDQMKPSGEQRRRDCIYRTSAIGRMMTLTMALMASAGLFGRLGSGSGCANSPTGWSASCTAV